MSAASSPGDRATAREPGADGEAPQAPWGRSPQRARRVSAASRRRVLVLIVLAAVLAGCGIGHDDRPRDLGAPIAAEVENDRTAITATATTLIYLVGHDDDGRFVLMPIARDVTETISNALVALFEGPTARELNADLRSAIPATTRLVKAVPNNDVVTIDVSEDLTRLSGSTMVDAIGQIVLTATNVTGVDRVVITVADVVHPWLLPDGSTSVDPLTRKDFESLLPDRPTPVTDPTPTTNTIAPTTTTPPVVETPPATTVAETPPPTEPPATEPPPEMGPAGTPA